MTSQAVNSAGAGSTFEGNRLQTGHLLAELQANRLALDQGCEIGMQRMLQTAVDGNDLLVLNPRVFDLLASKTSKYAPRCLNGFLEPSRLCTANPNNQAADKEVELPTPHLENSGRVNLQFSSIASQRPMVSKLGALNCGSSGSPAQAWRTGNF